ncbi:hypothetical protein LCGC14_1195100 [marine sediment metagenome]|uniref:Phosphoadenosine phosphosulphate reductase domain-containing protein n=1 Tax=marine sediment metagenome TaxID=412755 RepID=A0A0F9PNI5_9ZZZZ
MSEFTQMLMAGMELTLAEKTTMGVELLRTWEPKALQCDPVHGYWGCDSGGKDSGVIRQLAVLAGVKVRWHYNVTTIDPPEVCRFIRKEHPETVFEHRPRHFFEVLSEDRGFPTRRVRWCCQEFKEGSGVGKVKITGVRHEESDRRRVSWKLFQSWDVSRSHGDLEHTSWMCNPLVYWTSEDVWEFHRRGSIPYCSLYDEGWKRLGCVGCPMSGWKNIERDFARWPSIARAWRRAFERLWFRKRPTVMVRGKFKGRAWPGMPGIHRWEDLFEWWRKGAAGGESDDGCQMGLW